LALIIGKAEDSFLITQTLTLGDWHEVSIDITPENHLIVVLDNVLVLHQIRNLNYEIDNIIIGTGFSESRPFIGELKVHSLTYGIMEKNYPRTLALSSWILLTAIVFIIMLSRPIYRSLRIKLISNIRMPVWLTYLDNQDKIV